MKRTAAVLALASRSLFAAFCIAFAKRGRRNAQPLADAVKRGAALAASRPLADSLEVYALAKSDSPDNGKKAQTEQRVTY